MSNNSFDNKPQQSSIDIKSYIFKVLSYWKLFVVTITIGFIIAKFMNGYKPKVYSLDTTVSVKEENNPLFSTGTNIAFNWGGESNAIGTVKIILVSRTHNEKVVDSLQFYIGYFKDGRYRLEDAYGNTPFKVGLELDKPQIYGKKIRIEAISENKVKLSFDFNESNKNSLISYSSDIIKDKTGEKFSSFTSNSKTFIQVFELDKEITLPFLNITLNKLRNLSIGEVYYISFGSFNGAVGAYRGISVTDVGGGSSIVRLQMQGANKNRIVDYLNA